jgi:hypothetical protein
MHEPLKHLRARHEEYLKDAKSMVAEIQRTNKVGLVGGVKL